MTKSIFLLLWLMSFAPYLVQWYKHKSETEIARMTPAQLVDEWVKEQVHHRYDVLDEQDQIILKYVLRDGLKAVPRIIEIMDEYDPTRFREGQGRRGERFDACWLLLSYIDQFAVRLRSAEEGRRAMDALERAIQRMRAAGYGQPDQHEWERSGRFELAESTLEKAKGVNLTDVDIGVTLWVRYRILLSKGELVEFVNYLVARDPTYPSWSWREGKKEPVKDYTRFDRFGNPVEVYILRRPERFYEAYLEFLGLKKSRP